nr:RHS repeat-associated core domain-containing protein [uncultured Flavobacterium sp.]
MDDNYKSSTYGDQGFKDGTNTGNDYMYDANGNMTRDYNKGIGTSSTDGITYNHLNLPARITFNTGATIDYIYDASGIKQRKIVSSGITTDYAGGFQYENNILRFFTHPEGYVEYNTGTFNYIYQYKDHLGNVRLSYKDISQTSTPSLQILEENSYYPFGLKHKDNNVVNSTNSALKYKYNGKELQDELGLNMYDYGARNYDPALGRWINIDPHIEKYESISPYSYVFNNPVKYIDIKGKDPGDVVVVFGGGDIFKNNDKGGALAIQRNLQSLYSNSKGGKVESFVSKYWGTSLSDSESLDDATQGAYDYILSNYNKDKGQDVEGGKIIIEGYSYGGVLASHLASRLRKNKINIDLLVTVDTAAGPESDDINRTVSSNVKKYINIFQTNPSAIGSHGAENKKEKKSNTNGVNVDLTKITNEHGKIDEVAFKAVIQQILKELNN